MKSVLAALTAAVLLASFAHAQDKVFYCYFESWATYR